MSEDQNLSPAALEARKRASETINMAHSLLVTDHEVRKLPESVFQHHFLDFFTKQENIDPNRNYMAEWIGIAGTPNSKVDVVNRENEVIFTIPPMMDSSIVNLSAKGKSLKELMLDSDVYRNGHPGALNAFVNVAYAAKAKELAPGHSDTTQAEQSWEKVLNYYDLNPNKQSKDDQKNQLNNGDDLEYD